MSGQVEAAPERDAAAAAMHRKLVWVTFFRVVWVTVLLGGAAAVSWGSDSGLEAAAPLFPLVVATYAVSIVLAVLLGARASDPLLAYAQIGLDVALTGAVVALTGRAESVFVFMYSVGIVSGAILLYRRGALIALLMALAAHVAVEVAGGGPARWGLVFVQGSALAATSGLAAYLADQLRRTGERLAVSEGDLAAITALHEAIVQSVASGLVTLDLEGRVTFLNVAAEQITGISSAEARGVSGARWFEAFRTDTARGETGFTTAGGEKLVLGYSTFRLRDRDGRECGTAIIFQDLTELRSMADRVTRSERLADLGSVAAGLAHELRNPLASMMGSLELLRQDDALAGEPRRLMDIALREASRLEHLTTAFLAYARPAPPRPTACDVAPLVADTLDVLAADPRAAAVAIERSLERAVAAADPDQLKQVVWNLVLNAVAAAGDGGRGGRVRVSCGPGGEGVFLAVEDDGHGVDPADLHRIFLPFFTTKRDGTGLGLATVHRIVDAHGGSIAVEQAGTGGARFVVRLPAARPEPARAAG